MYCSNCGCKLEDNTNFCPNCGKAAKVSDINNSDSQYIVNCNPVKTKMNPKTRNIIIISCLAVFIIIIIAAVYKSYSSKNYLTGTWVYTHATATKVQFKDDGTCLLISGTRSEKCTYKVTDNKTVTVYYSGSIKNSIKFTIVDKDTLQIEASGNKLIFKKLK